MSEADTNLDHEAAKHSFVSGPNQNTRTKATHRADPVLNKSYGLTLSGGDRRLRAHSYLHPVLCDIHLKSAPEC